MYLRNSAGKTIIRIETSGKKGIEREKKRTRDRENERSLPPRYQGFSSVNYENQAK